MLFFEYQSPTTANIGDDVQTIAAMQFLPKGESARFWDRDRLSKYDGPHERAILNGWWSHRPAAALPPPEHVGAIPISMHLTARARCSLATTGGIEWMRRHRVGGRDQDTTAWLRSQGVDAYWSGCLTLTFPESTAPRSGVVFVDLEEETIDVAKKLVDRFEKITHRLGLRERARPEGRRAKAQSYLDRYRTAALVVTSRLHCALPCAAMGTPVVLVAEGPRFTGAAEFLRLVAPGDVKGIEDAIGQALADGQSPFRERIDEVAGDLRLRILEWLS